MPALVWFTFMDSTTQAAPSPLALHIRSRRQWYGARRLEQNELAKIAGISTRILRVYEASRELPRALECVLAVAYALKVSPEELVDPRRLSLLKAEVEERRGRLLGSEPHAP